jgi:hypothetical protein
MVRPELVAAKIGRARGWLNDAAAILLNPLETFLADPKARGPRARCVRPPACATASRMATPCSITDGCTGSAARNPALRDFLVAIARAAGI